MKAKVGQRARYEDKEWIVWEVDAAGAPSKLIRQDEHGFPIIVVVENTAKVILIIYTIWEPLKKMISDIWNAIFKRKRNADAAN